MRTLVSAVLNLCLLSVPALAQSQMVTVTVPKANVRSEPNEKAPILQQVTPKDQIEYRATEGDWFKVLLPPNPALGGARVEAYISRKVARVAAASASAGASADRPDAAAPKVDTAAPKVDTHAANVFLGTGAGGTLLTAAAVRMAPAGNRQAWTIDGAGDWAVAGDRRPSLVVSIGDRAGFAPGDVMPSLVRLGAEPGGSGRVVGSVKGERDWRADDVSMDMTENGPGVWTVKPSRDLKPGDYAIVLRPTRSKVNAPEVAWAFTVK